MNIFHLNQEVSVWFSPYIGAQDYVGQTGKIIRINKRGAHAVKFPDGNVWFYKAEDLKAA
jgi:hypothetical protein